VGLYSISRSRQTDLEPVPTSSPPALRPGRLAVAVWLLFALVASVVCANRALKAVDLHVYHAAARSFFLQTGPMYGPNEEFGWPMLYRYPPLFLCLFRPFASLPLWTVAGIWAALKVFLLGPLVWAFYRHYPPSRFGPAFWIPALIFLPYLAYELQVGNVQFFLVEMVCFALLIWKKRPVVSSVLLGLATAIKVWPVFIFPFLALRGRGLWRIGVQSLAVAAAFTAAPALWLGWGNFVGLLTQWFAQERTINALLGDRWYPSQSLRGVMLRYLTAMDYSGLPDLNYPHVNFISLGSWEVRQLWLVLAVLLGVFALVQVRRSANDSIAYCLFFCFLLIVEPNVQKLAYTALLWPILYAGVVMANRSAPRSSCWLLTGAAAVAVLQPLIPGAATQRLMQVLGIDFFGVLVPLTVALLIHSAKESRAKASLSSSQEEK